MSVVLSQQPTTSSNSASARIASNVRSASRAASSRRTPSSSVSSSKSKSIRTTAFDDVNDENSSSSSNNNQQQQQTPSCHDDEPCKPDAVLCDDAADGSSATESSSSGSAPISRSSSANDASSAPAAAPEPPLDTNQDDASLVDGLTSFAPPPRSHAGRFSESAVPEKLDPAFVLPVRPQDYKTMRSSLVSFEPSAKANDGASAFAAPGGRRSASNFVDFSGRESDFDAAQYFGVGLDGDAGLESSRASNSVVTPRSLLHANPYDGISIDVNNHSINNQGVVLYHVDIKGPEGLLSTYTIRRRYRAFKELHQKLQALISEYSAAQAKQQQSDATTSSDADAFAAENVPDSPHTQARKHERLQQIAENSVLSATLTFPALPNGGVWSYLKRHDVRLVEQRKKRFEEILRIAIRHPATKTSAMLDSFLSVAPSLISHRGGSSYVSLQDYSVPVFDRQRESIERKQLKLRLIEGRRQRTSSEASSSQS